MATYPPIRPVEAVPLEHEKKQMVLIRDPEQLCEQSLVVPIPVFIIMTMLDGETDGAAIQHRITQETEGQIVPVDQIDELVKQLDEFYLLANERSAARIAALVSEFEALETRPASHAGLAYPEDADSCRNMFDTFFDGVDRPGDHNGSSDRPTGIIAPHIDLRVGGRCLARGLATLDPDRPPRLYIVLGVAHQGSKNLFTLTDKSFETPLGQVETDTEAVEKLRGDYGALRLDGQYVHKHEHSIEFQALALKYLHRNGAAFKILPILCGSIEDSIPTVGGPPLEQPDIGEFVAALKRLVADYDGDVCIVTSVDLSHVGMKFGDEHGIDELRAQSIRRADEEMLDLIRQRDAEAFYNHFRPDDNARHVDAISAVYVMLHVLGSEGLGLPIEYEQWNEEETQSMVTYASMAFY